MEANPNHPALHFKQIFHQKPTYSVRVGLSHRAVGIKEENTIIWFWIGSHEDYKFDSSTLTSLNKVQILLSNIEIMNLDAEKTKH